MPVGRVDYKRHISSNFVIKMMYNYIVILRSISDFFFWNLRIIKLIMLLLISKEYDHIFGSSFIIGVSNSM